MRKAMALVAAGAVLVGAGCGGDTDDLEAQIADLQQQVAAQQRQIDELQEDTSSLRGLEQRVDELLEQLPDLGQLGEILDRLGIG